MDIHPEKTQAVQDSTGRLSNMNTNWTQLGVAHDSVDRTSSEIVEARKAFLDRYAAPVYQYLLACVKNEDVAGDLAQDFAVRFLSGHFENADRSRGRFRDFLKRSLSNLSTDYFRRQSKERRNLEKLSQNTQPQEHEPTGAVFEDLWRQEILTLAWQGLKGTDEESGSVMYVVLRLRSEKPDLSATEMAEALRTLLPDCSPNEQWVRQTLHRARKKFSQLLRDEVARTVGDLSKEAIDNELAELGLLKYCEE